MMFAGKNSPMRKIVLPVLILVVAGIAVYMLFGRKKDKPDDGPKQQPLAVGQNTGAFNESFTKLLTAYYGVKDALIADDTAKASTAALLLVNASDGLKLDEIKGDSTGVIKETAKTYTGTIVGSGQALAAEKDIKAKRKEFEIIADALWSLVRVVKYSGGKLYLQYCPMAFNNKGANWVSNEREVKNPYFGHEMPECGSVEDSLDYSK
jgi:hypothetical protein